MADMFERVEAMRAPKVAVWKTVDAWAMVRGKQSICKICRGATVEFELWGAAAQRIGSWPTCEEAMAAADRELTR